MKVYEHDRTGNPDDGLYVLASYMARDPKHPKAGRMVRLDEMPEPDKGMISFFTHWYTIPGLGTGPSGGSDLKHAALFDNLAAARREARKLGPSYPHVLPLAEAREHVRKRNVYNARRKARKIGRG